MKTDNKIKNMRIAGKILSDILDELEGMVKPDLETMKLEERFLALCKEKNVIPACKGYRGSHSKTPFPTGLCIGINSESVHCIPSREKILREGDIVVIDTVIKLNGYHVDSARTVAVGKISELNQRLIDTTKLARDVAINVIKPGIRVGDISNAMQTIVEMAGFNVLRGFTGHGVGEEMHEYPNIPCFGEKGTGELIKKGMTLAIEPLVSSNNPDVEYKTGSDWETTLEKGSNFSQFEHTVLVTENGVEILTKS